MATNEQLIEAMRKAASEGNMDAARRLAEIYRQKNPKGDSSLGTAVSTSIDRLQGSIGKGLEAAGRAAGMEGVAQFGTEMERANEQQIAQSNYQTPYPNSLYSYIGTDDFFPALGRKLAENSASLAAAPAGAAASAVAAAASAPAWVPFAIAGGTTGAMALAGAGESASETEAKTGSYDPKTAVAIGALIGFLDRFGAGKVIPEGKLANMSTEELVAELADKGFVEAAAAVANRTTKAAVGEGATEVAQESAVIGGSAAQGAEYTTPEVGERLFDAGALGTAGGGAIRGTVETAQGVGNVINPKARGSDNQAAADFARDIAAKAQSDGFDLGNTNVEDPQGARAALDALHVDYTEQLKALINSLRPKLRDDLMDEAQTRLDKVSAKIGFRKAKNKTKSKADKADYDAVERLVGDTAEGQEILRLMRKLDELTTLHNKGYKGGVSQFTDILNPLASAGNYNAARNTVRGVVGVGTGSAAAVTGGTSLIPQIGAVVAGRGIDALTGRRARVQKFVRDNQRRAGMPVVDRPSFIAQQQERVRAEEAKRLREEARRRFEQEQREAEKRRQQEALRSGNRAAAGTVASADSPQGVAQLATGLNPEGLTAALAILSQSDNAEIATAARELGVSMLEGGTVSDKMLTPLIRVLGDLVQGNPDLHRFVTRVPDNPLRAEAYEAAGIIPKGSTVAGDLDPNEGLTPAQRRGKAANIAFIATLRSQLAGDTAINPTVKEAIDLTLETYADTNLGQDPVAFIEDDMKKIIGYLAKETGVEQSAVENPVNSYIGRYLDRVRKQQAASKPTPAPEPAPQPAPAPAPEPQQPLNPEPRTPILEDQGEANDDTNGQSGQDQSEGTEAVPIGEPDAATNKKAEDANKAIFEIGKEGSGFEDGITSIRAAALLAEALGFKFKEYKTLAELKKEQRGAVRPNGFTSGQVKLKERLIWVYTGTELPNMSFEASTLRNLATTLHELGHAIDLRNTPPTYNPADMVTVFGRRRAPQPRSTYTQSLQRIFPTNKYSFEGIAAELRELQKSRLSSSDPDVQATDTGDAGTLVRPFFGYSEKTRQQNRAENYERGYLSDPIEMIADGLMAYMMNPKEFRQKYPETAKFIREATNNDAQLREIVKFYSITPLAAVGIILSQLLASEDDEEDSGILNAPRGALTA